MRRTRVLTTVIVTALATASFSGCALLPGAGSGAFCADFEDAGGSGAVPGVVPLFYPKEDLLVAVDAGLAALDVPAPGAIETEWTTTRDFYSDVKVAAEALEPGAILSDPELYERSAELNDEIDTISSYVLDNC